MVAKIYSITSVKAQVSPSKDGEPAILTVEAKGQVNSGGWSNPELGTWSYITMPADGILDLDFLASPPMPRTDVTTGLDRITASISLPVPSWTNGVRVHSSTNRHEVNLESSQSTDVKKSGPSVPWPWPWFREVRVS